MRRALSIPIALTALCMTACSPVEEAPVRNLLLVTLDTLRADHLGLYGYGRPTSPALDRFAGQATVFTDTTCSMPTTLPSHVSIFTGLRPAQHGVGRNGMIPDRDLESVFDQLAARGAGTAAVIGARVLEERYLEGLGFDEVIFPSSDRQYQARAEHVTAHAEAWLDAHAADPFALWVHYYDTHEPYDPPRGVLRHFDRGYAGELANALDTATLVGLNQREPGTLSTEDVDHIVDLYDAEIAYLDAHLGALLEGLERRGLLDETLVVIVGDHGQAIGESGFFGHGLRLLEPVIKVPLIVRAPGVGAGRRSESPVETIDLAPTIGELMGLTLPADLPGRSLVPALRGARLGKRSFRIVERRRYDERPEVLGAALHGGDWKAVFYHDEDGAVSRRLGRAPHDLDAVDFFDPDLEEARWLEAVVAGLATTQGDATAEMDEEQRAMLRALGYLD